MQYNLVRKNIIIGMLAVGINAVLAFFNDQSDMINRYYVIFAVTKWIVISVCFLCTYLAWKGRHLGLSQELVPLITIFFMCTGEIFAPGYNLAYTQLIIFIPMMLKIPFWRIMAYILGSFVLFSISIYFGQTLTTTVSNYPNYSTDVVISIFTSTLLGFLLATFVKRYEQRLDSLKSKYTDFGLNSSMIIHDLKNNLMAPYRLFSSMKGTPEADKAVAAIEDSIAKLQHLLAFHKDNQMCNPMTVIKDVAELMDLRGQGFEVNEIGELDTLPFSKNNLKSVVTNIFSNSIYMLEHSDKNLCLEIKYGDHEIEIRDNGEGFPLEAIKNFERYNPSTVKFLGNGIGLINSRLMIELCGGVMSIYNHPKGGAAVSIKFS